MSWWTQSPTEYKKNNKPRVATPQPQKEWWQQSSSQYKGRDKIAQQVTKPKPKPIPIPTQAKKEPSVWQRAGNAVGTGLRKFNAASDAILDPFMEGITLGGTKLAQKAGGYLADKTKQVFGETPAQREARHKKIAQREEQTKKSISPTTRKVLGAVGDVAGVIGGVGTAQGIAKATVGKAITKAGAKGVAKRALTEAGTGAIYEGTRAATEGKPVKEVAKSAGKGALLFGVAGTAGGLVGAGAKRTLPKLAQKVAPLADPEKVQKVAHYTGNALKGATTGAGFSYGGNVLEGQSLDHESAAKNALAFGALEILTGGKYKNISKEYEMLGEVNKAYERGKYQGETIGNAPRINRQEPKTNMFAPEEEAFLSTIKKQGLSLDEVEKIAQREYNRVVESGTPKDKMKSEGSLNAIRQLRRKLQGETSQGSLGEGAQTPVQAKRQGAPVSDEIAVNEIPQNVVFPPKFQFVKGGKKVKATPPLDPATAKERRFVSNSALNAEVVPEGMKQELKSNIPKYNPITNKETWDRATQKVSSNIDAAREEYRAIDQLGSADDTALGEALIVDAIKRGDIKAANGLTADLAEKLTAAGQTVQAAAIFKKLTPEGMLLYAQRVVNRVKREARMSGKIAQGEKMAADVEQKLSSVNNEAADKVARDAAENAEKIIGKTKREVKKLTPEEKLANKISGAIKPKTKKQNVEQEMINTLFRIASKDLPPKPKKNPLEPVVLALKDKNKYQEVWQKAKEILRKKYAKDPEKIEILEDYLEKKLRPVFEQGKLNSAIDTTLKGMNVNLSKIVKEHYTAGNRVKDNLVSRLVNEAGLTGEEAKTLENYIRNRMKELTKAKKEAILKQMFNPRTPADKTMIDRLIEYSNLGALQNSNYRDLVAQKIGIPHLDEETAKFISKQMQKIQTMPDGRQKDVLLAQVMQTITNKIPSDLVAKSRALRNIALLGNAKTFMRNVTGNVLMGGADTVANTVGATVLRPLDIYLSKVTGSRSIALPNPLTQAKGFAEGGKIAISDALGGIARKDLADKTAWGKLKAIIQGAANPIDTSLTQGGKWETGRRLAFDNKPMRILENAVNTSLAIGDRPFSQAYYDDIINQLKKVNKTKTVTTEMKQLAQKIAEERTYQDMNTISALAMGIKRLPRKIQNHPKLQTTIQIFIDSLLPYVKTPANILKRGLEYTPVGVVEGLLKLGSFKNAPSLPMQREIIDRISRGLVGTGIMVAGSMTAKKGLATGAPNKDRDVANFEKSIGISPYSIKSGDTYVSYDWAQPVSMPFGAGVQYAQKTGGDSLTAALDAAANALNYYTDQPMLQSMQRFLGSSFDSKTLGQRTLEAGLELPKQFVPTLLNQAGQAQDEYQREMYSPNFMENALGNPLKGKLPGARENLPAKVDTLGRPVESYQGNNTIFNVFFNPAFVTRYKPTPEAQMVLDIFRETGATEQFPRTARKFIMVGGKKYDLTAEEYTNLQRIVGELTRQGFSQIDPGLPTDDKIREMTKIMDYAGKTGRTYIKQQRGLE